MVEFSLVAGLLILLIFSVVDLGLILNHQLVLTHAARAGVRQAVVDGGASPAAYHAIQAQLAGGGIKPEATRITIRPRTANYGTLIWVVLEGDHRLHAPLSMAVGRRELTLKATMIGRSESLEEGGP